MNLKKELEKIVRSRQTRVFPSTIMIEKMRKLHRASLREHEKVKESGSYGTMYSTVVPIILAHHEFLPFLGNLKDAIQPNYTIIYLLILERNEVLKNSRSCSNVFDYNTNLLFPRA